MRICRSTKKLADAKKQIAAGKKELEAGQKTYDENAAKLDAGEKQYEAGLRQIEAAQQQLETAKEKAQAGQAAYDEGVAQLEQSQAEYDAGYAQYAAAQAEYDAAKAELDQGQAEYDAGYAQYAQGQAEYDAAVQELAQGEQAYSAGLAQVEQGEADCSAGEAQLAQGQAEYEAGIAALAGEKEKQSAAQAAYDAAKGAYDAAVGAFREQNGEEAELPGELAGQGAQLEEQRGALEGAQAQLAAQESALAAAKAELDQKGASLAAAREQLSATRQQLAATRAQLDAGYAELAQSEPQLSATRQQLEAAKAQLDAGYAELAQSEPQLSATRQQLESAKTQLDAGYAELAAAKTELDAGYAEITAGEDEITAGLKELDSNKKQLDDGRSELEAGKVELEAAKKELDDAQAQLNAGYAQLADAQRQLDDARRQLDDGWDEWGQSQAEALDGQKQLDDAKAELEEARQEIADGKQEIADAEAEIAENEKKLADGWADYEEGKQTAEEEIADAKQELADAEQEVADAEQELADAEEEIAQIKYPEWYVYNRDNLPENTGFGENAERMSNIGKVFPVLFFLVAALISLTTMTRMVEEERTQIGTLKALGYGKGAIASKYLKYAFYATLGGSIVGILFGEKVFPWVIITAYGIMYQHLPEVLVPYNWQYGIIASAVALLCTLFATFSACRRELRAVPATLMRPPAPKQGKRVFLEYLPFLWKPLSFSWKSTVRNLLRYKKRFLMTVIGIGGCMGLLLVGYGLRDSIMDVALLQFDELQHYEAMLILDTDASEQEQEEVVQAVREHPDITLSSLSYMQKVDVLPQSGGAGQKEWTAYLQVVQSQEDVGELFTFRDRETGEEFALDDTGAIVTEKIAEKFGLKPGDGILAQNDDGEMATIPVARICENYLSHYIYLTPSLYESVFGKAPRYNSILMIANEGHEEELQDIGTELLKYDAALNVTYTFTLADQLNNMLSALDVVMIVLIVSAGMLAFVVLYNLNNININERKRELATLKVLGFYDGEVGAYVYRENVLLTLAGAFLGIFIGKFLHSFVILTVEVDSCMFGREIKPLSYVYGVLFTFAFSVIVNAVMYFKLKKIDMVESLKSIE